jgi:hypothetical protein
LNGRQLAVTGTFGSGTQQGNQGNTSKTSTVSDDSNVITMDAPNGWEYDGSEWPDTWTIGSKKYDFVAQTLTISPNLDAYQNTWDTKGIFVATSVDWGKIGGYANLLEGVAGYYKQCTPKASQSYSDSTYEGQVVLYTRCGGKTANALVMVLRPRKHITAYLVLVEMKYTTDAELAELNTIVSTLDVNP